MMQDRFGSSGLPGATGRVEIVPTDQGLEGDPLTAEADAPSRGVANDLNIVRGGRTVTSSTICMNATPKSRAQGSWSTRVCLLTALPSLRPRGTPSGSVNATAWMFWTPCDRIAPYGPWWEGVAVGVEAGARAARGVTALTLVPSGGRPQSEVCEVVGSLRRMSTSTGSPPMVLLNGPPPPSTDVRHCSVDPVLTPVQSAT